MAGIFSIDNIYLVGMCWFGTCWLTFNLGISCQKQAKAVHAGIYEWEFPPNMAVQCPSSIPKWAPVRPNWGPTGAQLGPTGAQPGPTWNAARVESLYALVYIEPESNARIDLLIPSGSNCQKAGS